MADVFDSHQATWAEYVASPWARIRYAVVARVLADRLAELGPGPWTVLDVGGGDGLDSIPLAVAGHAVTILDTSEQMLAGARAAAVTAGTSVVTRRGGLDDLAGLGSSYDLVLCHFVLHYRPASAPDLASLLGVVRPGGLLSVITPNPASTTLARLVRVGPAEALAELGRDATVAQAFDTEVRKVDPAATLRRLAALGATLVGRYGARIANDLLIDDLLKRDPDHFADLLALELALHDREPYCRIGAVAQLVLRAPQNATLGNRLTAVDPASELEPRPR